MAEKRSLERSVRGCRSRASVTIAIAWLILGVATVCCGGGLEATPTPDLADAADVVEEPFRADPCEQYRLDPPPRVISEERRCNLDPRCAYLQGCPVEEAPGTGQQVAANCYSTVECKSSIDCPSGSNCVLSKGFDSRRRAGGGTGCLLYPFERMLCVQSNDGGS